MTRLTFPPSHRYWSPQELNTSAALICFRLCLGCFFFFFLDGATICLMLYTQDTYIFCVHVRVCARVNMALEGAEFVFKQQSEDIWDGPHFSFRVKAQV